MRKLMMIVSATAMIVAMPALAKPGKGGGHGPGKSHASAASRGGPVNSRGSMRTRAEMRDRLDRRTSVDRQADLNRNGVPDYRERRSQRLDRSIDSDGDGVADTRDRWIDRDRNGIDDRAQSRYGSNSCPPGLAKKNNGCLPPGQARKMFAEGKRLPTGYNFYTPYDRIPSEYRDQYGLDENGRYIYRDGRLYDVDPTTSVVRRIIEGLRF